VLTKADHNAQTMRRRNLALWAVAALLAVNAVLLGAQVADGALPRGIAGYFFGPKMVRAEVVVKDGGAILDYRIDRGTIRGKDPGSLTLKERDGTLATLPVAPNASVTINGRGAAYQQLRKGMVVVVIRVGDGPAIEVRAGG
jgi:hypothetical protein